MNNVQLIGRLTKEPELQSKGDKSYLKFSLAVQREYKDANGERQADFINCTAFNAVATLISKHIKKGEQIAISGRIQTGSYEDNNNVKHFTTDVLVEKLTFIGKATSEETPKTSPQQNNSVVSPSDFMQQTNTEAPNPLDDDLPF